MLALSHFQENIGDSPIQDNVDLTQINIDKLSPEDYLKMSESLDKERYQEFHSKRNKNINVIWGYCDARECVCWKYKGC